MFKSVSSGMIVDPVRWAMAKRIAGGRIAEDVEFRGANVCSEHSRQLRRTTGEQSAL